MLTLWCRIYVNLEASNHESIIVWTIKRKNRTKNVTIELGKRRWGNGKSRRKITKPSHFTTTWRGLLLTNLDQICSFEQGSHACHYCFEILNNVFQAYKWKTHFPVESLRYKHSIAATTLACDCAKGYSLVYRSSLCWPVHCAWYASERYEAL